MNCGMKCPFPNFKGTTVEVREWISDFVTYFTEQMITYPCWVSRLSMLVKVALGRVVWKIQAVHFGLSLHGLKTLSALLQVFIGPDGVRVMQHSVSWRHMAGRWGLYYWERWSKIKAYISNCTHGFTKETVYVVSLVLCVDYPSWSEIIHPFPKPQWGHC